MSRLKFKFILYWIFCSFLITFEKNFHTQYIITSNYTKIRCMNEGTLIL